MRRVLAVAVVASTWGNVAQADDSGVEHTRRVVRRYANDARQSRTIAGVTLSALGVGLGALGYYTYASAHESNQLVDFSPLQRGVGVTMIAVGGIVALSGPFALLVRTDPERMHDTLERAVARGEGEQAAREVHGEIGRRAAAARSARRGIRAVGYTLAGAGTVAVVTGLAGADHFERDTRNLVIASGAVAAMSGAGFVIGSLFEGTFESYERDLDRPRLVGGGLVPVRGGAVGGVALTF